MLETVLFYAHSVSVLIFGVFLSVAFSGITLSRKNSLYNLIFCLLCGGLQLVLFLLASEQTVRFAYPLITHLPVILYLVLFFRRRISTALAAMLSSYLLCQPAKWMGILAFYLFQSLTAEYIVGILCLVAVGLLSVKYAAPSLGGTFNKDLRSVSIFGLVPLVYYLFDYGTVVYTDFWQSQNQVAFEFLPFLLCLTFLLFCTVYYREYERKADAERKEQIVRIVAQQQAKYTETAKQIDQEVRILRHDMLHLLNRLTICIDSNDIPKAKEMLQSYISYIDGTQLTRFCGCDTVNYVLSAFAANCEREHISFHWDIQLDELAIDELMFCSILQNALDNAYNAQLQLAPEQRSIHLLLKHMDSKLLLSVKNPTKEVPVFSDGLPLSRKPGHGYGAQSIRYLSERLGGSCQFSYHDGTFILRVVL